VIDMTVGIEWIQDYHGSGNLSNTKAQAEGFANNLTAVRSFNLGDDWAWDRDFEEQGVGVPPDGTDAIWGDTVDFAFLSGHGNTGGVVFGRMDRDNGTMHRTEVRLGNTRLNWLAVDACEVLHADGLPAWTAAFGGLHYILGFHTVCGDEANRGRYLAGYLNQGFTVREAWIRACQETEGSATEWAYLRADGAGTDTFSDHWIGHGFVSPDPNPPTRFLALRGPC